MTFHLFVCALAGAGAAVIAMVSFDQYQQLYKASGIHYTTFEIRSNAESSHIMMCSKYHICFEYL